MRNYLFDRFNTEAGGDKVLRKEIKLKEVGISALLPRFIFFHDTVKKLKISFTISSEAYTKIE